MNVSIGVFLNYDRIMDVYKAEADLSAVCKKLKLAQLARSVACSRAQPYNLAKLDYLSIVFSNSYIYSICNLKENNVPYDFFFARQLRCYNLSAISLLQSCCSPSYVYI